MQRRVLIFDFENQTRKLEYDYLAGSIADALSEAIRKTGKFRLMSREDARVNTVNNPVAKSTPEMKTKLSRNDIIKLGHEAGADVVVLGIFNELKGVLLLSAQAYEADTRQLKVSEDILSRSNSEMFDGINKLAEKIAESMARELPMFDPAEAERRRATSALDKMEERDWELQVFAGLPLLQPLYGSDGTVNYAQPFPVQKLRGYTLGAAYWHSALARRLYFMPKESRFGLQGKVSLLSGSADFLDTNSTVLSSNDPLNGIFVSGHLLLGIPYFIWRRIVLFAEFGIGAVYTQVTTNGNKIFASAQPSGLIGTSAAYHWSFWSLGLSYRAQVALFSQSQAFVQHDFWVYAGLRL